jgi:hypothetical protein
MHCLLTMIQSRKGKKKEKAVKSSAGWASCGRWNHRRTWHLNSVCRPHQSAVGIFEDHCFCNQSRWACRKLRPYGGAQVGSCISRMTPDSIWDRTRHPAPQTVVWTTCHPSYSLHSFWQPWCRMRSCFASLYFQCPVSRCRITTRGLFPRPPPSISQKLETRRSDAQTLYLAGYSVHNISLKDATSVLYHQREKTARTPMIIDWALQY